MSPFIDTCTNVCSLAFNRRMKLMSRGGSYSTSFTEVLRATFSWRIISEVCPFGGHGFWVA